MTESTPIYLQPAFVVFVLATAVGGIGSIITFTVWLIRQEAKIAALAVKQAEIQLSIEKVTLAIQEHKDKDGIHFNETIARLAQENMNARMTRLETDVRDIKSMVQEMTTK